VAYEQVYFSSSLDLAPGGKENSEDRSLLEEFDGDGSAKEMAIPIGHRGTSGLELTARATSGRI